MSPLFRKRRRDTDHVADEGAAPTHGSTPKSTSAPGLVGPLREVFSRTEPQCPYCTAPLDKMPGRKKKCPHCGNAIYVRSRPSDKKPVLVREDEQIFVEAYRRVQRSIEQCGWYEKRDFERAHKELRRKFGSDPSEADVRWRVFNKKSIELANNRDWGLYTSVRQTMAEHLVAEGKESAALDMFLEACYLDLNGPTNRGDPIPDPDLERMFPLWDPERAFEPTYSASAAATLAERLSLDAEMVSERFRERATRLQEAMKIPVSPERAWSQLLEFFEDDEE